MENMTQIPNSRKISLRFIEFTSIFKKSITSNIEDKHYIWMTHVYKFLKNNTNIKREYLENVYKIIDVIKLHGEIYVKFTHGKNGKKEHFQPLFMSDPYYYLLKKNHSLI